jgi:hypothetical protein
MLLAKPTQSRRPAQSYFVASHTLDEAGSKGFSPFRLKVSLMPAKEIDKRVASLCGGGALLLFLDRFFDGALGYLLSGAGLVLIIVGLTTLFRNKSAG